MLDKLINFELTFLFFQNKKTNIIMTIIITSLITLSLYLLPEKDLLAWIIGGLIIWERVLLLKIKEMDNIIKNKSI